ncbi:MULTISPECIES: LrgB family protein [unclassified Acinetobacter]|uniref:LrgB family protein n=1 Tax=unclassified Acinetobacter TaxID=196816 RepID=UPI0035B70277
MFSNLSDSTLILIAFVMTFIAYLLGKQTTKYLPKVPIIVSVVFWLVGLLWLMKWDYQIYAKHTNGIFSHLLGYVTVALAIPLASMRLDDLPLRPMIGILIFASLTAVGVPMLLAVALHMAKPMVLAFATRAVTTPIALNIASILGSDALMVTLIVILSGVIGAACSGWILRNIKDERAAGLAIGLAAHAIGTAQAWQRGVVAGRYAAFGMAVNAVFTAFWLPVVFKLLS